MRKQLSVISIATVLALGGCASSPEIQSTRTRDTAIGAGIGAGTGALIGAIAGKGKGAAIGAAAGAGLGAIARQADVDVEVAREVRVGVMRGVGAAEVAQAVLLTATACGRW